MDVKDQLKIATQLNVLELCLKYPEHERGLNENIILQQVEQEVDVDD